ncbi:hypothetical protein QCD79_33365, partial [Pseudomonas quasicaspiana]|nr:hypothetical protein [Pseudomonas quasicaspiana]
MATSSGGMLRQIHHSIMLSIGSAALGRSSMFWLATQNIDDLPKAAEPMLNMIEWWICLNMPPDEVA